MTTEHSPTLPRGFWPCVLAAALVPTLGTWYYFVVCAGTPAGKVLHLSLKGFELLLPVLATLFLFRKQLPKFFARAHWPKHLRSIPAGAVLGFAIVGFGVVLLFLSPLGPYVREGGGAIREKLFDLGLAGWFWPFAFVMSILHSALEEYYWRWFVLGNLARALPFAWANVLAALAFTGHHVIVVSQFFPMPLALILSALVGVGGLIWSILYRRQGTLMGAWVSHMIADFGIMIIGWNLMGGL